VKEKMGNIHKQLSIVYGNPAVDRNTVGRWVKRNEGWRSRRSATPSCFPSARNVMVTVFCDCEGVILLDVMQRGTTIN
jgi:Transposase.